MKISARRIANETQGAAEMAWPIHTKKVLFIGQRKYGGASSSETAEGNLLNDD